MKLVKGNNEIKTIYELSVDKCFKYIKSTYNIFKFVKFPTEFGISPSKLFLESDLYFNYYLKIILKVCETMDYRED